MRISIAALLSFFASVSGHSQNVQPVLYKDAVFSETLIQKDLSYATTTHAGINEKYFLFDLYQPKEDVNSMRPLIIWLHGGGLKFGSKKAAGIRLWCENFARRGYVCAGLNYPLGKNKTRFTFSELKKNSIVPDRYQSNYTGR
jgi:carboxylesterase type B